MKSLSQSTVKTFLRCPKKFEYRHVENLQEKTKPLPMERGIWIHECLEAHYKGRDWRETLKHLRKSFRGLFDEERELYGDLPGEVNRIMQAYLRYWDDSDWEVLDAEREFTVKLKSGLVLRGKMDTIIRDNLGIWVVEHKSNKVLPREAPRIPDPQTTIYNYALKGMGLEGMGTIHNHVRTKPPNEPRVLKRGGLSVRCDTDYRTYARAIKREGLDLTDYKDVLRKLKHEQRFFRRFRIPWKKTAVRPMMEDYKVIWYQVNTMTRFPRHISKMCERDCEFFKICMIELHGGNATSVKKKQFVVDRRRYG